MITSIVRVILARQAENDCHQVVERPYREDSECEQKVLGGGPCLVSRADGKTFKTGATPPMEDLILAPAQKVQSQFHYRA
jgi:hypothetical protein